MNKYLVELIGTFFLVLTVGCTVIEKGAGPLAPIAIGAALMVMIYAGGHISGGHYNPAVTLGVWMRGKCDTKGVGPYMAFQIVGAVLAAAVVKFFKVGTTVDSGRTRGGSRAAGRVSVHVCAGVRGAEFGHREGHGREFVLRTGDRHDGDDRRVCRRQHFRRRVQSRGGGWNQHHGTFVVVEHLDFPGG